MQVFFNHFNVNLFQVKLSIFIFCVLAFDFDDKYLSCSAARYKDAILQCCKIQTARYKDAILQCCKIQRCYVAVLQENKRYLTVLQDKYLSSKSKAKTYKNKKKNA